MKKLHSIFICICVLFSGCSFHTSEDPTVMEPMPETAISETVMDPQPQQQTAFSQEMAMLEGFVVMQDGDVRHNAGGWFAFLEKCNSGENATITVAQYAQTEGRSDCVIYELSYDGKAYILNWFENGNRKTISASALLHQIGILDETSEPYDSYEQYTLNNIVLYQDLIAEPDYEGVTEIFLHAKEGEPPIKTYSGENLEEILQLLMAADYMTVESENYLYGMKLLMTNRDGKELVIELDLRQGVYRYGMQNYAYGEISDLFSALDIDEWPEQVQKEFSEFLN